MNKIVKQVVGIDVAQDELVVCFGKMNESLRTQLVSHQTFANNKNGFEDLKRWTSAKMEHDLEVQFVMEATGVYHEGLAYFLHLQGYAVSIVLPNKISNYGRTLQIKTVTDKTSSQTITQFGLERNLDTWTPAKPIFRRLRQLTRERSQLMDERTMIKNQLHAEKAEAFPLKESIARMQKRLALLNKQEAEIMKDIKAMAQTDKEVARVLDLICTIPGIGLLTAATVLGETNGFELIRNKRQLTSYAGLDVREKQSGTSVRAKPRISKKGNKHLRKAFYFPALSAIRHNDASRILYERLLPNHNIKMKAAVAVQRKLLEMTYTIYKKNVPYDKEFYKKFAEKPQADLSEQIFCRDDGIKN